MELGLETNDQIKAEILPLAGKSARVNAVAFDGAELRASPTLGQGLYLVVRGPAPGNGAQVRLSPVLSDHEPEYRRIEIVSDQRAGSDELSGAIKAERYEKSMPLSGIAGSKGVELVGANGNRKFSLTG